MPFEDGAFDSVVSTFGHMFAPRHQSAADEMARVRRKGGAIATCTWTPEGTVGELFRVSSSYMPAPPDFASPPILWGSEDHVRDMFGVRRVGLRIRAPFGDDRGGVHRGLGRLLHTALRAAGDSAKHARRALRELRERTVAIWEEANEADDGRLRFPQEYLLSLIGL